MKYGQEAVTHDMFTFLEAARICLVQNQLDVKETLDVATAIKPARYTAHVLTLVRNHVLTDYIHERMTEEYEFDYDTYLRERIIELAAQKSRPSNRLTTPNDRMSRFCTAITALAREHDAMSGNDGYPFYEVAALVYEGFEEEWEALFNDWNMDPKVFADELNSRLSPRAAYDFEGYIACHWYRDFFRTDQFLGF